MTRIVFILSYPADNVVPDTAQWLRWDNRDRRMPGLLAAMGADVELWGVGAGTLDVMSGEPFAAPYRIRLFAPDNPAAPARARVSAAMSAAVAADPAALFVVIGTNGAAGYHVFDHALRPDGRCFAVIIGGDYWSRIVPHAALVLPESAVQERLLARPGARFWRTPIPPAHMERLPKSIDMDRFAPGDSAREWDLIAVSRLNRWKSFDEIGALSQHHRVAVVGGGDRADALAAQFPKVAWLGRVPNGEVPALLGRSRAYFHTGRREYFPRAIVEAMACGLPVIGFDDRFGPDVIPPECGLLVNDRDYRAKVAGLLAAPDRLAAMGAAARAHAVATHGLTSSAHACATLHALAEGR